jgi:hypothetical protein
VQVAMKTKPLLSGAFAKPSSGLEPETPPYHGTPQATGCDPRQRFCLDFPGFWDGRFATGCHRLQPRGSIKGSILCRLFRERRSVETLRER